MKEITRLYSLIIYDAEEKKPPVGLRVIVAGGSAFWTGQCWKSIMDAMLSRNYYTIEWEVKWWAEFPKFTHFSLKKDIESLLDLKKQEHPNEK